MGLEPGFIQDLQRLLRLSDILNLDDCEIKQCFIPTQTRRDFEAVDNEAACSCMFAQMCSDFQALRNYFELQKRIYCIYGVESTTSGIRALKEMEVLIFQLAGYWEDQGKWQDFLEAFCYLKSQLCLELREFVDEVVEKVETKLHRCSSPTEETRLMQTCFNIRKLLPISM
ncbi:uncharacterized protein LOC118193466 isoform X1 [Stegodyphus dumicola]|uniref:uncharacterized protein LOC118193466 isoform X1 n=1 Tax=Stegodyphus dumicola TaxID=202533 RepID=UPI0015ACB7D3|nr:uncharacterized protein LOC118193466 isoform X1 [Stegodyphus dumicola]XP_035220451.1 uncharacterized protein LOC118193466 isoform X1 [Stegodyphus dumicola]